MKIFKRLLIGKGSNRPEKCRAIYGVLVLDES